MDRRTARDLAEMLWSSHGGEFGRENLVRGDQRLRWGRRRRLEELTTDVLADLFHCTEANIRSMVKRGTAPPSERCGRNRYFPIEGVHAWLREQLERDDHRGDVAAQIIEEDAARPGYAHLLFEVCDPVRLMDYEELIEARNRRLGRIT